MNKNMFPPKSVIEDLRRKYPEGARVELVGMDDPYTVLKAGDRGTVLYVDDAGTVHVKWDSGSSLGVVYGADRIVKLNKTRL